MSSSSLAADAAPFDFSFPSATPSYDPSGLLDIPYTNYFAPAAGHASTLHGHGHGHTRSSSQCSAFSAYSFASSGPSAPSDAFVSHPNSRQGTPAPAPAPAPTPATTTATTTTTAARRTRSPIRTHGPLLLPKIRSQDQALGADADRAARTLSPPKRARTNSLASVAGAAAAAAAAGAASRSRSTSAHGRRRNSSLLSPYTTAARHVRSATNPDNTLFYASMAESTPTPPPPPPPMLLCEPVHFAQQQQPMLMPQQQQQQQQQAEQQDPSSKEDGIHHHHDGAHDNYDYGFAPYPGTVPTPYHLLPSADQHHHHLSSAFSGAGVGAGLMLADDAYLYQYQPQQPQTLYHVARGASPLSMASVSSSSPAPPSVSGTPEPPTLAVTVPVASSSPPVPVITETPPSATTQTAPTSTATTTLLAHLTGPNPAPALVRTISFPLRDPNTKHYWWDVRQVQPWTAFTAAGLVALPGAADVLSCPVAAPLLAMPSTAMAARPETEADLHALCAAHYLPRVNAALALSSARPVQLTSSSSSSSPSSTSSGPIFVGNVAGDSASAAALFGGRPTARVVGLVKSFDRFNTGMRAEGNVKRVEYLRGLAHLHHAMREHSCRYGFLLTEIELVVVRNGTAETPQFGQLEVASVALAAFASSGGADVGSTTTTTTTTPLTACLALWGLCMLASEEMTAAAAAAAAAAQVGPGPESLLCHYHTHIGAPAEGTRQNAAPRDAWMPQPQLAEKRTAKRARGWVMPEDAVGRKEMGRRGVRYGGW